MNLLIIYKIQILYKNLKNNDIFEDPIGQVLLDNKRLKLLIFDEIEEVILRWIG